jgi:hypothetical protein
VCLGFSPLVDGQPIEISRSRPANVPQTAAPFQSRVDAKLHVVLCVNERAAGFCFALTDEMGIGVRSVFFDVEVHDPRARRRRGRRIRGIGDFTDLRQLYLRSLGPDEN